MARKSAREEAGKIMKQFVEETKAGYLQDIQATRIPSRRRQLLFELDALDSVAAKLYGWLNGLEDAA